jgi:hypothetical protein
MLISIRYIILVFFGVSVAIIFLNPHSIRYAIGTMFAIASLLWLRRTLVEFGYRSVRGQFTAMLGLAFLIQAVGCLFIGINGAVKLTTAGLITFGLARFLFVLSNVRYAMYFLRRGYLLPLHRLLIVLLFSLLVLLPVFLIPGVWHGIFGYPAYAFFVISDLILVISVFYNLVLLWGTEITVRWVVGSLGTVLLVLGDALFAGEHWAIATLLFWMASGTFMAIIGTIRT